MAKATHTVISGISADGLTWNLAEAPLVRLPREPRDMDRIVAEFKRPDDTLILGGVETRPVPGLDGRRAGRDGSVWSCRSGRWHRLRLARNGRMIFVIIDGRRTYLTAGALILGAWGSPRPPGMEVFFKDGDPSNCALSNLTWAPRGTSRIGRPTPFPPGRSGRPIAAERRARGEFHGRARLTYRDVVHARLLYRRGRSLRSLARRFGVEAQAIRNAISGATWSHVPDPVPIRPYVPPGARPASPRPPVL